MPEETAVLDAPASTPAPDPSTNTAPGDTTRPSEGEWDDLEPGTPPDDRQEFWEDREAREEEEAKSEETTTEDKPENVVETEAKPEGEQPPAEEAEVAPELKSKAEEFDFFDKVIRENPAGLAVTLLESLPEAERAKVLGLYGQSTPAEPEVDFEAYEPASDMEAAIKARWKDLTGTPAKLQEFQAGVQDFQGKVAEAYKNLGAYIDDTITPQVGQANIQAEILSAKLDAVLDLLGMQLPDPDLKTIQDALKDGRTTYKSAVRKVATYQKQLEAAKQARKPRPDTPGNGTKRREEFPPLTSAETIARAMGTIR